MNEKCLILFQRLASRSKQLIFKKSIIYTLKCVHEHNSVHVILSVDVWPFIAALAVAIWAILQFGHRCTAH